jgi:hypothetical protein
MKAVREGSRKKYGTLRNLKEEKKIKQEVSGDDA